LKSNVGDLPKQPVLNEIEEHQTQNRSIVQATGLGKKLSNLLLVRAQTHPILSRIELPSSSVTIEMFLNEIPKINKYQLHSSSNDDIIRNVLSQSASLEKSIQHVTI
jgi:hypothetical protein